MCKKMYNRHLAGGVMTPLIITSRKIWSWPTLKMAENDNQAQTWIFFS